MEKIFNAVQLKDDCSNVKFLPDITITLEDKDFILKAEDYVLEEEIFSYNGFLNKENIKFCSLAIMKLDVPLPRGPVLILGVTFLKKFYSVFDRDNRRIGFSIANN